MQARYVQDGRDLNYTPVSAVDAGAVVLMGTVPMISRVAIAANALGSLSPEGVWEIVKDSSDIAAGDAIYWDADGDPVGGVAGTGAASGTATGNNLMGTAVAIAGAAATTVLVKLNAAKRTATIAGSVTADDITGSDSTLAIAGLAGTGTNNGGTASLTAGIGGDGATGNGGAASLVGGAANSTNGVGGAAAVTGGIGKGNQPGGAVSATGGVGGATGAGGAASVTGGAGGSGSGTGGAVAIAGGAGSAGNANGGAVTILGGNAHGSGTDGVLSLGTSNTSAINVGAASIPTTITGPVNRSIGASTIALGSTNADAAALPAGTASVYPTTAADDTVGVIINAADKVTGRMLFIGNGVKDKTLKVYPPAGGAINGNDANAAFSSVSGKGVIIICLDSGANTWLAW